MAGRDSSVGTSSCCKHSGSWVQIPRTHMKTPATPTPLPVEGRQRRPWGFLPGRSWVQTSKTHIKTPRSLLPFLWEGRQKRPLGLSTRLAFQSFIERFCVKAKWIGWRTVEEDTWSLPPSCYVHTGLHGHKRICISHIHSPYSLKFPKSLNLTQKINGTCQCVPCLIWYLKVRVQMSNKKPDFSWLYLLCSHTAENAIVVWHRRGLADCSLTRRTYSSSYPVI